MISSWLRREWGTALLLLGMLVLRVLLVRQAIWTPVSDSRDYHDFAFSLMDGTGYRQVYEGETRSFRGLTFYAYRSPGYPVVLAFIYTLFGRRPFYAYLANVGFDLVTAMGILWIGRRLFDRRTAWIAAAIFGIHVAWTASLMTECLFTALLTTLAALVVCDLRARTRWPALGYGLLQMAAVFVRPIGIAALPVGVLRIFHSTHRRRAVALSILLCAPLVLAMGAWSYRSSHLLGRFVLLTTNFGPHNARSFDIPFERTVMQVRSRGGGEVEIDRTMQAQIRNFVVQRPGAALLVWAHRAIDLVRVMPGWFEGDVLLEQTFTRPRTAPWARQLYATLCRVYPISYGLALAGALIMAAQRRSSGGLWMLVVLYVALHALVSWSEMRFAAPLYPFFSLSAAFALVQMASWTRRLVLRSR